jgi:CheY-like chemotaxis protein
LRADSRTADLPIVAYTAHALAEERERIMAVGFDEIVIKPVTMAGLLATLSAAVDKRSRG